MRRQLQLPVGITWGATPFREAILDLGEKYRVCIWIDRRIDPGYKVEFSSYDEPLDATLKKLAAKAAVGVGFSDSFVYLGPRATAAKLATLVALRSQEAERLSSPARDRLLGRQAMTWDALATPRELIGQLAREAGIRVVGIEHVQHDLWPAGDLPAVTVVERLSLVLAGFDLTFEIAPDGTAIRLIPMPSSASVVRTYNPRGNLDGIAQGLVESFPQAKVKRVGPRLAVSASYEDHLLIERVLRGEKVQRAAVADGDTRYTVNVTNQPLGVIVKTIALRLNLNVEVDPRISPKLHDLVSFQVDDATPEEFLQAAFQGTGIRFRLSGKTLQLSPAE
jgi:hypothetical protein